MGADSFRGRTSASVTVSFFSGSSILHRDARLLRIILAGYVDANPTELVFHHSEKEKPSLISVQPGSHVEFNASHSDAVALVALRGDERSGSM
jgi:phosphopantetheinyl transferase